MAKNKLFSAIALIMILSLALTACGSGGEGETIIVTQMIEGEAVEVVVTATPEPVDDVVTLNRFSTTDIPTLDPQIGEDEVSITHIENLFVQLTNYDLITADIMPEAATDWAISDDGLVYTFNLRTDIPWVYHNPVTGETTQVIDEEGNPRFVTAEDFVYGIQRACDPNTGGYYSSVIGPLISGCTDVLYYEDAENVPTEMVEAIGATAPSPDTLIIELEFPASYFLAMTPLWTIAATPSWTIAEHDTQWIEAGNIVTNGRFVLSEWIHGVRWIMERNPLMPADMYGTGNLEIIVYNVVPDASTGYALWLNNEIDTADGVPDAELQAHLEQFPNEVEKVPTLGVFYIGFAEDKPPFDNVLVRRAFSAAYDRDTHVDVVEQNQGLPMIHFAPPGIFGAPRIDQVGLGYDPELARELLAEAGYPNCEGFPQVTLIGYTGQHTQNWIEFAQAQWSDNLGCDASLIQIEQMSFANLLTATAASQPVEDRPHMWTLGWGPDYADENNWVGDVLWCQNPGQRFQRPCSEVDTLIEEARLEPDQARRAELYTEIEEMLFGTEGEIPFIPIYLEIAYQPIHTWLDRVYALFGGQQYYNWSLDMAAKVAAQQ